MPGYVVAIDQGTTSSRVMIFDEVGGIVSSAQKEHRQIFPQPGWVEHDATEIWRNVSELIGQALGKARITRHDIASIGITNQRETLVVWERATGHPVHNAIVWQDTRSTDQVERLAQSGGVHRYRSVTGLPLDTYFTATKLMWLLEERPELRSAAERGDVLAGTIDSWLLWNLTGGPNGGRHATDVTNASRTLLMDLSTSDWSESLLQDFGIPRAMLPDIQPSIDDFGQASPQSLLRQTPITAILGDQQASLFGHRGFEFGDGKNTYGTGGFVLVNTAGHAYTDQLSLLTTVAYQRAGEPVRYALEGSIAVAGSLIQWLRDNLGLISDASQVEALASTVPDNGGAYIVPAFSGLFSPHWRPDARGTIVGLTRFVTKAHLARAALEAAAHQTDDVLAAIRASGVELGSLKVDGGMTTNTLLMQFQSDLSGTPVEVSSLAEMTAFGSALASGLGAGVWSSLQELRELRTSIRTFTPSWSEAQRSQARDMWARAVERSLNWA